jgi:mono/diheme cytochrome c family protein
VPSNPETEVDLLVEFLTDGSEANTPYGLNGFGSGRMPAFGAILSAEDIELLAAYLRSGNMDGSE